MEEKIRILISGQDKEKNHFQKEITESFDGTENNLFKVVGKTTYDFFMEQDSYKVDFEVYNENDTKIIKLSYCTRGTYYDKKGDKRYSMHCMTSNYYMNYPLSTKKEKYVQRDLRCINSTGNNYKKYIIDVEGNSLTAKYGSIDVPIEECRSVSYKSYMYWILYYEKLSKGYVDMTATLKDTIQKKGTINIVNPGSESPQNANEELYKMLYDFANGVVSETLVSQIVTKKQCEKSRKLFEELKEKKTVKGFNSQLEKLMVISPRKRDWARGDTVRQYLANSKDDFERIIDFEETLILSMEALVMDEEIKNDVKVKKSNLPSFDNLGIEVFEATAKQKEEVLSYLNGNLKSQVHKVYRVKPAEQEKRFAEYCKKYNISTIKKLWHGSTNGNWFSITTNSLNIPKRATNGRMFGDGIYFAPSADKSFGYTSYRGSRWACGKSNVAIMGLYATAYGTPYHPSTWGASYHDFNSLLQKGCNCLHARSVDTGLRADEIIFYNPDAIVLNYIVVFK